MDSAPSEKPAKTSRAWCMSVYMPVKTMNRIPRPSTANPATPKPITAPALKETLRALAKDVLAACVVLTFALVAIFMPTQPANALKKAPIKKAIAMTQWPSNATFSSPADHASNAAAIAEKIAITRHSARKKAKAPRAIWPAISCIFASPASCLLTQVALTIMTKRPKIPSKGAIH